MKRAFPRVRLTLVRLLACLALGAGVMMFSVAPAHAASAPRVASIAHAASAPRVASTSHAAVVPNGSSCYMLIKYNYGANFYCVNTTGYNGINVALYDVIEIDTSGCLNHAWVLYHDTETSPGIKEYMIGNAAYSEYKYKLTQVDVYATSC